MWLRRRLLLCVRWRLVRRPLGINVGILCNGCIRRPCPCLLKVRRCRCRRGPVRIPLVWSLSPLRRLFRILLLIYCRGRSVGRSLCRGVRMFVVCTRMLFFKVRLVVIRLVKVTPCRTLLTRLGRLLPAARLARRLKLLITLLRPVNIRIAWVLHGGCLCLLTAPVRRLLLRRLITRGS